MRPPGPQCMIGLSGHPFVIRIAPKPGNAYGLIKGQTIIFFIGRGVTIFVKKIVRKL